MSVKTAKQNLHFLNAEDNCLYPPNKVACKIVTTSQSDSSTECICPGWIT